MRLQLITTGDMERQALAPSIARAFGRRIEPMDSLRAQSITATRLPPFSPESVADLRNPFGLIAFATRIIASAAFERRRHETRPDLLLVVDDLELVNRDQPDVVVAWLRWALDKVLEDERLHEARAWLLERCSFHLFVPMAEAYFFGDPAALAAAGVSTQRHPRLVGADLERFETDDRDYLAGRPQRSARFHPKHYLSFLANGYSETRHGTKALTNLRWEALGSQTTGLAFARAMFEDIAVALGGAPNPLGPGPLAHATWRGFDDAAPADERHDLDKARQVLRNI